MDFILKVATAIDKGGGKFLLALVCVALAALYYFERQSNKKLQDDVWKSSKEAVEALVSTREALGRLSELLKLYLSRPGGGK